MVSTVSRWIVSLSAKSAIFLIYASTLVVVGVIRCWRKQQSPMNEDGSARGVDVVCLGTFYNDAWLDAHAMPFLEAAHVNSTHVVTDEPLQTDADVSFQCPSKKTQQRFGRSFARLIASVTLGLKLDNPWFMGYHIMPNTLIALLSAAVCRGRAVYQMTGGPVQIAGGGYQSENRLLGLAGTPSRLLQRLAFAVVRRCDVVVVRGANAAGYVSSQVRHPQIVTVTAAIDSEKFKPASGIDKQFDALYVGRLAAIKGAVHLIEATRILVRKRPDLQVGLVGDGSERAEIEALIDHYGLGKNVTLLGRRRDVNRLLSKSRLFVLLSDSEGMSIAMLESMMSGTPVVVVNVGELESVVKCAEAGVVLQSRCPEYVASELNSLLEVPDRMARMGTSARAYALQHFTPRTIGGVWDRVISDHARSRAT